MSQPKEQREKGGYAHQAPGAVHLHTRGQWAVGGGEVGAWHTHTMLDNTRNTAGTIKNIHKITTIQTVRTRTTHTQSTRRTRKDEPKIWPKFPNVTTSGSVSFGQLCSLSTWHAAKSEIWRCPAEVPYKGTYMATGTCWQIKRGQSCHKVSPGSVMAGMVLSNPAQGRLSELVGDGGVCVR